MNCNVRTMVNNPDKNRPQRRSALIAYELASLDIDIAAIDEVRFSVEGSLLERGTSYTL